MKLTLKKLGLLTVLMLVSLHASLAKDNRFYVYNASNGLADNSAQTVHCTKTGRLVITALGQINFFDGQKFSYIDPSAENIYPLSNYSGNHHLYFDRYHHMWLKSKRRVTCVNLTTESFVSSVVDVFNELGVQEQVLDLFADQKNEVWLLTKKGVYSTGTKCTYPVIKNLNLQDLDIYEDKYLLLFYENGLLEVLDLKTGKKLREVKAYDDDMSKRFDRSSVLYSKDKTFFQIRNGEDEAVLMSFNVDEWKFQIIMQEPYHLNNIAENDNILYIPSSYGYWTYDCRTGEKTHNRELPMALGGTLLTDINAIAFDKQGGMWAGTERRGLLYSRPMPSPFQVYTWDQQRAVELSALMDKEIRPQLSYKGKSVNCVFRDSRGWDWVGTTTGLHLYKRQNHEFLPEIFTNKDGLLNNVIHSVIEDKFHNIWVGTSYGLYCLLFDKGGKFRYINCYIQWDNIPSESFVNGRAMRLADGTIIMQMLDHVIEFNPGKMGTVTQESIFDIHPKLTRLMVNGNVIRTGQELDGSVILEKALSRTSEINLSYNQNTVSLTFSGLNFFRPHQTFYRVRVNGLDDTWRILTPYNSGGLVDRQGQLHLPLAGLRPGSYRIEVQASMMPDVWDSIPYEWVVNINEPWWRTTGMLMLLVTLILVLAAINVYYYIKNTSMRTMRNSEEQGVIKRVKNFSERCLRHGGKNGSMMEPIPDETHGYVVDSQNDLSPEFEHVMMKIMPLAQEKKASELTMRELSSIAGMDVAKFYQLIIANIYKSPRPLARKLMLKRAAVLLETTDDSLDEIAYECGFVSANYLIASFYRYKKMTPETYRRHYGKHRSASRFGITEM